MPDDAARSLSEFEKDVLKFQQGTLDPETFKGRRTLFGICDQRQDGVFMLRVRVAGGVLPTGHARAIAALASESGVSHLHLTSRQDVQLHGLSLDSIPHLLRRLLAAGLTTMGAGGNAVRNVAACPLAGVCSCESFDVTPFALRLTEYLIARKGSYGLPRKFKTAFSGCPADCSMAALTDLGFVAASRDGQACFRVYGGGGMGNQSRIGDCLMDFLPARQVLQAGEAMRRIFEQHGDRTNRARARLRFVAQKMGTEAFRDLFLRHLREVADAGQVPLLNGDTVAIESTATEFPSFQKMAGTIGIPQKDRDLAAIPIFPPLGNLRPAELERLAAFADSFSAEKTLRLTAGQQICIRSVAPQEMDRLVKEVSRLNPDFLAPTPLHSWTVCTGASICRPGICDSREAARQCARALQTSGLPEDVLNGVQVRVSGCPNSCGHHPVGEIGLCGLSRRVDEKKVFAYRISLGGRIGADRARFGVETATVPVQQLPSALIRIFRHYSEQRKIGESFSDFASRRDHAEMEKILSEE